MSDDSSKNNESQDDFEAELRGKVEGFFKSGKALNSKEDLDDLLDTCGLLEIWDSEEEKQAVWDAIITHKEENGSINCDCVLEGFSDLLNRVSENQFNFTTFFSEMDLNKLSQYKTLFGTLDIKNAKCITMNDINSAITINGLTLLSDEVAQCISSMSEVANDNYTLNEMQSDQALNALDKEIAAKGGDNDHILYGDNNNDNSIEHHEIIFENPIELVDELVNIDADAAEYVNTLLEIKNTIWKLNNSLVMSYDKIIRGEEEKTNMVNGLQEEIRNKITEYDKYIKDLNKNLKEKGSKTETLKNLILKQSNQLHCIEEDYKQLYQKYQNNQQVDIDEEMERLVDENVMLNHEREEKDQRIELLEKTKNEKENLIATLQLQMEDIERDKEDLRRQIKELKATNDKIKKEYNTLVNDVVQKIQKEEEKQKAKEEKQTHSVAPSTPLPNVDTNKQNVTNQPQKQSSQPVAQQPSQITHVPHSTSIPEMKRNLQQMNYDNLLAYTLKVDIEKQALAEEQGSKDERIEQLTKELNEIRSKYNMEKQNNIALTNENERIRKKNAELVIKADNAECYRPSLMMSNMRISRMSVMNNTNPVKKVEPTETNNKEHFDFYSAKTNQFSINSNNTTPFNIKEKNNVPQHTYNITRNSIQNYSNNKAKKEEEKKKQNETNEKLKLHANIPEIVKEDDEVEEEDKKQNEDNEFNLNDDIVLQSEPKKFKSHCKSTVFETNNIFSSTLKEDNEEKKAPAFDINANTEIEFDGTEIEPMNNSMEIRETMNIVNEDEEDGLESAMNVEGIEGMNNEEEEEETDEIQQNPKVGMFSKAKKENPIPISNTSAKRPQTQRNKVMKKYNTESNLNKNLKKASTLKANTIQKKLNSFVDMKGVNNKTNKIKNAIFKTNIPQSATHAKSQTVTFNNPPPKSTKKVSFANNNPNKITNSNKKSLQSPSPANVKPPKTASGIKVKQFTPTSKKNSVTHSKANTDSLSAFVGAKHQYSDIYEQFSTPISKDFLQLSRQDNIAKILDDNHDKTESDKIFSDVAFEIDENKKIRRNIIITPKYFYLVDQDEFKCLKIYKGMSKAVMTNKNPNTIVLVFQSNEGIAIETMRPNALGSYLRDNYRLAKGSEFKFAFLNEFTYSKNGKDYKFNFLNNKLQKNTNFEGADKFGYLMKYKERKLIGGTFNEKFVVLTNVGLIYFNNDDRNEPKRLIPVIGSDIKKLPDGGKYKRPNLLEINNGEDAIIFAAMSEGERDSWYEALRNMQKEYEEKMKKLDTVTKEKAPEEEAKEYEVNNEIEENNIEQEENEEQKEEENKEEENKKEEEN